MSDLLPQGWAMAPLGEVVEDMKNGLYKPASVYAANGVACLRMYNIYEGRIIWKDIKRMKLSAGEVEEYQLLPGDLLVNRVNSRELVGKAAVIPQGIERCVFESKNIRVRFRRGAVCPEFINYALLFGGQRHFTQNAQQVVGMASISQPQVSAFPLSLPPLAEQRRIVVKLEKLLGKVDACQKRLAKVPALLKRFRQSVLAAACSGYLTADWRDIHGRSFDDWREEGLAEICSIITDGDHQPPPKQASGIPFLTIGDVSSGQLDFSDTRFVSDSYFSQIKPERRPVRGDVLYTVVATIGIPVLVNTDRAFCFQRHIALLRASKVTTPAFLWMLLGSPAVVRQAWSRATGTAQPTLSLGNLRTIPINLPPLAEQQEIVPRVEALFALADQIEARLAKGQAHVDKLTTSLLAKAFRGELVPTEAELSRQEARDYEPASVLLERIRGIRPDQRPDSGALRRSQSRGRTSPGRVGPTTGGGKALKRAPL